MVGYEEIIEGLIVKRNELEERLARIESSLRKTHAKDSEEQAIERENEEVVEALEQSVRSELEQVRKALRRVDENEFGKCVICDGEIRPARLLALPFTDRCIECAKELD